MEQNSSKIWLWVVGLAVLATLGGWLWQSNQAVAPAASETAGPVLSVEDSTVAIDQELNATDFGDLEKEMQSTEADLQSL